MSDTCKHPVQSIVRLAERLGISSLATNYVGRCWEHQVDERWWFAINPNREPVECGHGVKVLPFNIYVEFNGWPAGVFTLDGDGEFAAGEAANEDAFIAALERAADEAQP